MKQTVLTALAASMMLCGCYFNRDIDETIETDRYTLNLVSDNIFSRIEDHDKGDTLMFICSVPRLAKFLADITYDRLSDDTTMCWIDEGKQTFLPRYYCYITDHDTAQPADYTPLLHAMMERGILRADTTYEPLQLLEIYDSTRFHFDEDSIVKEVIVDEDGDTVCSYNAMNVFVVVTQLRDNYRLPVSLAPGVDPKLVTKHRWMNDNWEADSLWLDSRGMRLVPDPQGRRMRIVEFNRQKGEL